LKLKYDKLVSNFAINFNLRHYMTDGLEATMEIRKLADVVFSTVPIVAVGAAKYFHLGPPNFNSTVVLQIPPQKTA